MLHRLIAFISIYCMAMTAIAEKMDFYSASVLVSSQSAKERARAAEEGLKQVLVRVSGSTKVVLSPSVIASLTGAYKYLEQYHYEVQRLENGDKQESLAMSFPSSHIRRILTDASEPIWPTNRPKVLVWLVEDIVETGKQFVTNLETPVTQGLQQAALTRGLPITFPLMDLDDQLALTEEQVWALDEDAILEASKRYQVDTILVGRYTETSQGKWWGTWQFFHHGQNRVYDMRTETGEELGVQAIDPIADYLARLYSITTNTESAHQLYVSITKVDGFRSYKGLMNYLDRLAVVSSYDLVSISGSEVLLGFQLAGSMSQLESAISLDNKIQVMPSLPDSERSWLDIPSGSLYQPLKFIWAGK